MDLLELGSIMFGGTPKIIARYIRLPEIVHNSILVKDVPSRRYGYLGWWTHHTILPLGIYASGRQKGCQHPYPPHQGPYIANTLIPLIRAHTLPTPLSLSSGPIPCQHPYPSHQGPYIANTLIPLIRAHTLPDTIVHSDQWQLIPKQELQSLT